MKLERLVRNKLDKFESASVRDPAAGSNLKLGNQEFEKDIMDATEEAKIYGFTHIGVAQNGKEEKREEEAVKKEKEMVEEFDDQYNHIKDLCLSKHELKMRLPPRRPQAKIYD